MTALEQLMQQIDHLSPAEKNALRKRLDEDRSSTVGIATNGAKATGTLSSNSQSSLWGFFGQEADALDRIENSAQ